MTGNDKDDTAAGRRAPDTAGDELSERIDEIEDAIIAERDEAGVPGRVSERENVQKTEPDDQAPA